MGLYTQTVALGALALVRIPFLTTMGLAAAATVLVAVLISALALEAAANRHTHTLPILLVLTLLGFVSSVSIARFTKGSDDIEAEQQDRRDA